MGLLGPKRPQEPKQTLKREQDAHLVVPSWGGLGGHVGAMLGLRWPQEAAKWTQEAPRGHQKAAKR